MGSAIGAVSGGVSSLFGGRARRAEEQTAQGRFEGFEDQYDTFGFQNNYLGLENTAEDLTVNRQAAEFQAQQAGVGLSQGLDAILQSGGGAGGAQAIANAALQSRQGISADIAGQEQSNRQARASQAQRNQLLERQGAERQQAQQFSRIEDQYSISSDRLAAAKAARAKATSDLVGGVVGGAALAFGGGLGSADGFSLDTLTKNAGLFGSNT